MPVREFKDSRGREWRAWEVTPDDIDRVVGELAVAGRAASTRREYVQIFKGFHRFLTARKGAEIEAAARANGLSYRAIPITHAGFSTNQNPVHMYADGTPIAGLTQRELYMALAKTPFGKPNKAKTWKDVNSKLPALPIRVYGPPSTSGTRDALGELIGVLHTEDVLDVVFRQFCVGK